MPDVAITMVDVATYELSVVVVVVVVHVVEGGVVGVVDGDAAEAVVEMVGGY